MKNSIRVSLILLGTIITFLVSAEEIMVGNIPVEICHNQEEITQSAPVVTTKLTADYPLEMPSLMAYPLYVNALADTANQVTISNVEIEIGGTTIPAQLISGYYLGWWTPSSYGNHTINIKATDSNSQVSTETITIEVVSSGTSQNVQTFNGELINFDGSGESRWFYSSYTLPQSVGIYGQIMANFEVTCPSVSGGCDDWDRLAYIEYKTPDGNWMELFRYITPYGIGCSHEIDVTDYSSMLHGNLELRMFVDTWGTGGWDVHLDFDYVTGTPQYLYSNVKELWHGYYSFGNPANLQPLDTLSIDFPGNTQRARFRITTTGHGWGDNNSNNAAEFYNASHNFKIDNSPIFAQNLWNDCDPNPDNCNGQFGTWQYNRAGWCPGTIAPPNNYELTNWIGYTPFDFSYIFAESYQDECHVNNPSCITGTTCPDCNDGYNPAYQIGAYLITYSDVPQLITSNFGIPEEAAFDISIFPNPGDGRFYMDLSRDLGKTTVTVDDVRGATLKTFHFTNKTQLDNYQFDVSSLGSGTYFVTVRTPNQSVVEQIIVH